MDKWKNHIMGAVVAVLLGSGAWGWQYAFSTEARLVRTETLIIANMEEQKEFRARVIHTLDRLEDKVDRIQEVKIPIVVPPKKAKVVVIERK